MISHVSLGVREFAKSAPFYDAILDPLGYPRVADTKPNELAYGPPGAALFWLYETPGEGSLASAGMHIAFQVATREHLHRAATAAKEFGSAFAREPGAHPDIAPDYYGAAFFDPDGHKLELVVEPAG
jgi:catechol 2,3-dioxygenase-like lactoylglutathione lyase family enzyme